MNCFKTRSKVSLNLFASLLFTLFSTCFLVASIHRRSALRVPNGRQTLPDPRVSVWRRTIHAAGEGRHLYGGHGVVGEDITRHSLLTVALHIILDY